MILPAINDTIVAVATGWAPATLGIVRLSGPRSLEIVAALEASASPATAPPVLSESRLRLEPGFEIPATLFRFPAPRSYTGQDVVELHVTGCLPVLRLLCDACIALGARRALPGEFTARAFVGGKLDRGQVAGVLQLIHAHDGAAARAAARAARGDERRRCDELLDRLLRLLALLEAGIDFVEEDDIRFIAPAEVCAEIDALLAMTASADGGQSSSEGWSGRAHVALVGRPNAGKSTLFNALLGYQRAIVSPVLGTTRDVLSAEIALPGVVVVLQDCAGLGDSDDELDLAAHRAAEQTADLADLVLWVHARGEDWTPRERAAYKRVPSERRLLVLSKGDQPAADDTDPPPEPAVTVSAANGQGLSALRNKIADRVANSAASGATAAVESQLRGVRPALQRARELAIADRSSDTLSADLLAFELRLAAAGLREAGSPPLDETILGRIFGEFCVGK